MDSRPLVLQTEHLDADAAAWLAERSDLVVCAADDPRFLDLLPTVRGLIVRTYTTVDESLLQRAKNLKVIGRAGAGLDNIDLASCRARGVQVVYTPDANTQAVVEYVFWLLGDSLRPRPQATGANIADWTRLRAENFGERQLNELTFGILGLGRVGSRVARVAAGFGSRVIYNDLAPVRAAQATDFVFASVDQLFQEGDILTIHIDGRPSNRAFVNERLMSQMKDDVTFINTSRGFVVDPAGLARFMRQHPTAEAHLDVHDPEPFGSEYPLLGLPNVRLYPHLASRTQTAMRNMSWVVRDVDAVLRGEPPRFPAAEI